MSHRFLASTSAPAIVIAALLAPAPVAGQSAPSPAPTMLAAQNWTVSRTADDQPDLQGVWDYRTITPMERPRALGSKAFFTDEEAANFEKEENRRQNRDLIDPKVGGLNYPAGGVVPYNEFWYDRGNRVVKTNRTSLIIDPPDGRFPPMTPEGKRRMERRAEVRHNTELGHPIADSWEDRPLQERCLLGLNAGPPMFPGAYNNNVQIFQNGNFVVLLNEMVHDARVIPMDGRPHGHIPQWKGDSRGHWEGDTLVVDTINFKRDTTLPGSTANMHLTERLTRADPDTLVYEFTVDDPTTWTRPWTAQVPMSKTDEPIYEYACHEGNYALPGILAGARADEKAAAEAAKNAAK
ncbi:MAG TPA: hypothetical protein VH684_22570 [Xanthobacteraceae bacterium]|jgi:hypothetical protein